MNDRRTAKAICLVILSSVLGAAAGAGQSTGESQIASDDQTGTLTVAVVSSHSVFDPAVNIRHFEQLTKEAAAKGARLVCFP